MWRRVSSVAFTARSVGGLSASTRRTLYERVRPVRPGSSAKLDTAKNALLQLNVMIDQGIQPDIFMYTSLISLMGDAGLEWQAYKLFSRLLEQGLQPLPETYVALQRATSPTRTNVIADLERRIHESAAELPTRVALAEDERQAMEDREAERAFDALFSQEALMRQRTGIGAQPTALDVNASDSPSSSSKDASKAASAPKQGAFGERGSIPTMTEVTPKGALMTEDVIKQQRCWANARQENIKKEPELRQALSVLHDEELRILLTVHRQFRDGSREELVSRILHHVAYVDIMAVIHRRKRYFAAVAGALELQMKELQDAGSVNWAELRREVYSSPSVAKDDTEPSQTDATSEDAAAEKADALSNRSDAAPLQVQTDAAARDVQLAKELKGELAIDRLTEGTITARDEYEAKPDALIAPWGVVRKRMHSGFHVLDHANVVEPAVTNPQRDALAALTPEEELEIYVASRTGEIHKIPNGVLRKYARQHRVGWRRSSSIVSLQKNVAWHVETFPPALAAGHLSTTTRERGEVVEARIQEREREVERRGFNKTVENFEALRIIAQRCGNAQIVDSASISGAIARLRRQAKMVVKAEKEAAVRSATLTAAQTVDESLRQFPVSKTRELQQLNASASTAAQIASSNSASRRVLGLAATSTDAVQPSKHNETEEEEASSARAERELPPWAVKTGSAAFNFRTGRFGDPKLAQLKERADGKIGVSFAAQRQEAFRVDIDALPPQERAAIKGQFLEQELAAQRPEATAWRHRQETRAVAPRYVQFHKFLEKAAEKKRVERAERLQTEAAPLQNRRMALTLTKGRDQVKAKRKPPPSEATNRRTSNNDDDDDDDDE